MPDPAGLRERVNVRGFWRGNGVVLLGLLLSLYAWWPMFAAYPHVQGGDGPYCQHMFEVAWASWRRWHELPLWNPYQCGGAPYWDNPQTTASSPLMWLLMPFGSTRGMELWLLFHLVLAFVSMWLFARRDLRVSAPAAIFAACCWTFCGYYNQHLSGGHVTWGTFGCFPLALFLWRRADRDARFAVATGMLVAWELSEGAPDTLPHLAVLLAAETLTRMWPPRRMLAIVRAGLIVLAVSITLSACHLLPVIDQLHSHSRELAVETDAMHWSTLKDMFLARTHSRGVSGQQYVWPEFDSYLGPIVLALGVFGLLVAGLDRAWLLALLAFNFALMLGHVGEYAPWSILKAHVYPFKQMRVPSRFNAEVTLFLAALAAIGVDRAGEIAKRFFRSKSARNDARLVVLALAFVGVGDMITVGSDWLETCFTNAPAEAKIVPSPNLYIAAAEPVQFIDQPRFGVARTACWEEWAFHSGAPVWTGDVPQARALDTTAATLDHVTRTQNTFSFDVEASLPTRILLNSAYDLGWRSNIGVAVANNTDLLAVDVPAGSHHVTVKYWPRTLTLGFWLSGLSAIGIAIFFALDWRKRRHSLLEDALHPIA